MILGLSAGFHDAGATLVDKKGNILFAGHSERYSGIKNDANLNRELIDDAMNYGRPTSIAWYENDGAVNPSFSSQGVVNATAVHVADIDSDGDLDIISASHDDDTVAWYESDVASNNDVGVYAQVDDDYTATSGSVTFSAGETVKTFTVTVKEDLIPENNEAVQVVYLIQLMQQLMTALVPY